MSRYSVNGLPWASGIGTNVEDCTTSKEVMKKAGLDFMVDKCELVARMPFSLQGNNVVIETTNDFAYKGHIYRDCPNAYATYRTDTNVPLGLVKQKYEVIQNFEAFDFFDEAIGKDKAVWQRAGQFGYGHKIFVTAKLPITIDVNNDPIDNYLVFSNSHDGTNSVNIMFTPIRVACTNMLNGAINSASCYIRIKHTKNARERIQSGSRVLNIACQYASSAKELYDALTKIKCSDDVVLKYLADLVLSDAEIEALHNYDSINGYKKLYNRDYLTLERTNISTRKANQITNMFEYYMDGIAQKNIAGTAWGAYNAVTGFYCNVANLEGAKRMESLLWGGANSNMMKAFNSAFELKAA